MSSHSHLVTHVSGLLVLLSSHEPVSGFASRTKQYLSYRSEDHLALDHKERLAQHTYILMEISMPFFSSQLTVARARFLYSFLRKRVSKSYWSVQSGKAETVNITRPITEGHTQRTSNLAEKLVEILPTSSSASTTTTSCNAQQTSQTFAGRNQTQQRSGWMQYFEEFADFELSAAVSHWEQFDGDIQVLEVLRFLLGFGNEVFVLAVGCVVIGEQQNALRTVFQLTARQQQEIRGRMAGRTRGRGSGAYRSPNIAEQVHSA